MDQSSTGTIPITICESNVHISTYIAANLLIPYIKLCEYCPFMAESLAQLLTSNICTNYVVNPRLVRIFQEWSGILLKSLISFMLWCGCGRRLTLLGQFPSCTLSRYLNFYAMNSHVIICFEVLHAVCYLLNGQLISQYLKYKSTTGWSWVMLLKFQTSLLLTALPLWWWYLYKCPSTTCCKGRLSGKQHLANKSITPLLCPQQQTEDRWSPASVVAELTPPESKTKTKSYTTESKIKTKFEASKSQSQVLNMDFFHHNFTF